MAPEIVWGDITKIDADIIVNAANPGLQMGGGVCGAIFSAAGPADLQRACDAIGGCETGGAVITGAFALPSRYIIHAVGPVWRGGTQGEAALLASCYAQSLHLARRHGARSVAFPLISAGIYGYPRREALQIAVQTIERETKREDMQVFLVLYEPRP